MSRSCEEDPAFDYLLTLFVDAAGEQLTVLPTHRVVRGLGDDGVARLLERLDELFEVRRDIGRDELRRPVRGGRARARWGRGLRALDARRRRHPDRPTRRVRAVPAAGRRCRPRHSMSHCSASRSSASPALDADAVAAGAVGFTKSAAEAVDLVDTGVDGADAAFLLEPTPIASVVAVARDGDVMPQKSTYFYPKALTGLVINPHEW